MVESLALMVVSLAHMAMSWAHLAASGAPLNLDRAPKFCAGALKFFMYPLKVFTRAWKILINLQKCFRDAFKISDRPPDALQTLGFVLQLARFAPWVRPALRVLSIRFNGILPELREIGEGNFSFSSGKRENGEYGEKGK